MKIFCSCKMSGFYIEGISDDIPPDALEIDEAIYNSLMRANHDDGMEIDFSSFPPTVVQPQPLSAGQLISLNESRKSALLAEASAVIAPLRDALDGGYIKDADTPRLEAWQRYRYDLTGVDTANPVWPPRPDI